MEDSVLVRRRETQTELARDLLRFLPTGSTETLEHLGKIAAIDILHGEKDVSVDLGDVIDLTDVGVGHLAGGLHLGTEALESRRVGCELDGEKLERHRLAELEIVGAVDLAHPSPAEETDDAIAGPEHGARKKPAVVGVRTGA